MRLLNFYYKIGSLIDYIRGFLFNLFLLDMRSKNLKVSNNVQVWGKVELGNNIKINSGVKIYKKVFIADNVSLGDNVELRCNQGNSITIGENSTINRGTLIMGNVIIGSNCLIAPLCVIVGSNHNFSERNKLIRQQSISSKGIIIGDNVWIGANVSVIDGIKISKNCIIGAGSVVTKNIPPNSIGVGNPCKVIKQNNL